VEIAVVVLDVERIDDAIQGFSANVLILAQWSDTRLAHSGSGDEWLSLDTVWHPRLQVANLRRASSTLPDIVEVTPDGTVTYRQRLLGEFSQKLDLSDFPLDRQTLAIQLVSMGNLHDEVLLVAHPEIPSGVVPDVSISDWEILDSRAMTQAYQPMGVSPRIRPRLRVVFPDLTAIRRLSSGGFEIHTSFKRSARQLNPETRRS